MKINTFITSYKYRKTDEEKIEYVKNIIKNEYIPLEKKTAMAKAIVDSCYWQTTTDANGNNRKELHIDSVAKYMLTCMSIIDLFTNIERHEDNGKILDDFNILNSSGIFDLVVQNINQNELKEFYSILQMVCDDTVNNEYENHAYFSKQLNRFEDLIIGLLSPVFQELDVDKVKGIIQSINK